MNYEIKKMNYFAKVKKYGTVMEECCDRGCKWLEPRTKVVDYYEKKITKESYNNFFKLTIEERRDSLYKSVRKEEEIINLNETEYNRYLISEYNKIEKKNTKSSINNQIKALEKLVKFLNEKIDRDSKDFYSKDLSVYKEDYAKKLEEDFNIELNKVKEKLENYKKTIENLKEQYSNLLLSKEDRKKNKRIKELNKEKNILLARLSEIDEELKTLQ